MPSSEERTDEIHVRAPAKINLILRILDRLSNGYHRIWSIMHTVDLADRLVIRKVRAVERIQVSSNSPSVPKGPDNLIHRAAELVLRESGLRIGLEIELDKQIPMAAGLGGGSSDAAATILGIVRLLDLRWPVVQMARLGSKLGSDIPFFFFAPSAVVCEWGQSVYPLSITGERWTVLVNPGFPIETKWAYERVSSTRDAVTPLNRQLEVIQEKQSVAWPDLIGLMENDFESALFPDFPELAKLKSSLLEANAQAALLSGSGATMIGIFPDEESATLAKKACSSYFRGRVFVAKAEATSSWILPAGS